MGRCLKRQSSIPSGIGAGREEGLPLLVEKFKTNLRRRFAEEQQQRILDVSLDRERLELMPVNEYVDLYVTGFDPGRRVAAVLVTRLAESSWPERLCLPQVGARV